MICYVCNLDYPHQPPEPFWICPHCKEATSTEQDPNEEQAIIGILGDLLEAMADLPQPEQAQELLDMLLVLGNPAVNPTRHIVSMTSACTVCGYVESVDIPQGASVEDVTQAITVLRDFCPECEEMVRLMQLENSLMEAAINNDNNLTDLVQAAIETLDEETANKLLDKVHQIQKEALSDIRGWKDYDA